MNPLTVTETISLLAREAQHAGALAPVVTESGQGIESIAAENGRVVVTFSGSKNQESARVRELHTKNLVLEEQNELLDGALRDAEDAVNSFNDWTQKATRRGAIAKAAMRRRWMNGLTRRNLRNLR